MNKDPLAFLAKRIAARKEAIDAEFAPLVRNHLVQFFRKAHAVEPGLTGVIVGNGIACVAGQYSVTENGDTWTRPGHEWSEMQIFKCKPEVEAFMTTVRDYSDRLCSRSADALPYVSDITLDDLVTERSKKARVWRSRQVSVN